MLRVLDTGIAQAQEIMDFDAALLENLRPSDAPLLHLYEWEGPAATYGYFIDPAKHLDLSQAQNHRLSLARRPTGGGIVFHIGDLAFSFLLPAEHPSFSTNTLANYQFVNQIVLEAMRAFFALPEPVELIASAAPSLGPDCQNFCMAKPTQYDVVYQGRKIAGAAQRRRKQGYLHQGTISLALPDPQLLAAVLRSKEEILQAMQTYTFSPLGQNPASDSLRATRARLAQTLAQKFMAKL